MYKANWPPAVQPQANQLRVPTPHFVVAQRPTTAQDDPAECRTVRPQHQIRSQQSRVSDMPQPSIEDTPGHPSGMHLPFAIPPGCVPPPPTPRIDAQGYDLYGETLHRNASQTGYRPALSPVPNEFDMPTPKGPVTSGDGKVLEPSENNDSSKSEAWTGTDSIPDTFSSEIEYATMCTSNGLGSEGCTSPPDTDTYTLKAKRPTNDCMEAVVASCVKKYKEDGVDALLNEVLHEGTRDSQRSLWNATVTRLVFNQLEKQGIPNIEQLYQALRSEALRRFKEYCSDVSVFLWAHPSALLTYSSIRVGNGKPITSISLRNPILQSRDSISQGSLVHCSRSPF
jgi:hypothetical protein